MAVFAHSITVLRDVWKILIQQIVLTKIMFCNGHFFKSILLFSQLLISIINIFKILLQTWILSKPWHYSQRFCWIFSILKVHFTIFSVKAILLYNILKRKKHTFKARLVAFVLHSKKTNLLGPRKPCKIP